MQKHLSMFLRSSNMHAEHLCMCEASLHRCMRHLPRHLAQLAHEAALRHHRARQARHLMQGATAAGFAMRSHSAY